jgi:hypothetical protein
MECLARLTWAKCFAIGREGSLDGVRLQEAWKKKVFRGDNENDARLLFVYATQCGAESIFEA